ncbi:MAG: hypothetical protein LC105_03265 [Chitinophagales bacterium]|nr:hypothetical protein [Chitinophagales bacterium]MCO5247778.1 hypothetical protein [Chitinophagales bacterium]MCZ2392860.1 hypothetical protein [Chitinophagales bacterium]
MSIIINRYSVDSKLAWNSFIDKAKNGLFFFNRGFMDYHSDRFKDHSLMFYKEDILIAVFPANENGDTIFSHQGLTFGSLLMESKIKTIEVLEIFNALIQYYKTLGFKKILYKAIPPIFSSYPAQEDLYALFRNNASIVGRDIFSIIEIENKLSFSSSKRNLINKLIKKNYKVENPGDFKGFWELLTNVLKGQHNSKPTHSLEEIQKLKYDFKQEIQLFIVKEQEDIVSGVVVFDFGRVVHTQYMASNEIGRKLSSLDFINNYLMNEVYSNKKFFSFGTSNHNQGRILNEGLIHQKELMGARGIVQDYYELEL